MSRSAFALLWTGRRERSRVERWFQAASSARGAAVAVCGRRAQDPVRVRTAVACHRRVHRDGRHGGTRIGARGSSRGGVHVRVELDPASTSRFSVQPPSGSDDRAAEWNSISGPRRPMRRWRKRSSAVERLLLSRSRRRINLARRITTFAPRSPTYGSRYFSIRTNACRRCSHARSAPQARTSPPRCWSARTHFGSRPACSETCGRPSPAWPPTWRLPPPFEGTHRRAWTARSLERCRRRSPGVNGTRSPSWTHSSGGPPRLAIAPGYAPCVCGSTGDWRTPLSGEAVTLLERLEYARALKMRAGSDALLDFLETFEPPDVTDWHRIALSDCRQPVQRRVRTSIH